MPIGMRHLKRKKKKRDVNRVSRTAKTMPMSIRVWLRSAARYSGVNLEKIDACHGGCFVGVRIASFDYRYFGLGELGGQIIILYSIESWLEIRV